MSPLAQIPTLQDLVDAFVRAGEHDAAEQLHAIVRLFSRIRDRDGDAAALAFLATALGLAD